MCTIDVHVATVPWTPPNYQEIALESLEVAAQRSPIKINIHVFEGVVGHIGMTRYQGFEFGSSPYVTYIDDDDIVLPNAFVEICSALEVQPDAVFPNELGLQPHGTLSKGLQRHHLPTYRRSLLIDPRPFPVHPDLAQREFIKNYFVVELPEVVYHHRLDVASGSRLLSKGYPDDRAAALDSSNHFLLEDRKNAYS